MGALVKTLRPRQWVKNVFVLAALVFARHMLDVAYVWRAAAAFVAFCLVSGAVYTFNDVRDVEADRAHPTKKNRPIAAGLLSERAALTWAGALTAVALAGAAAVTPWLALVVAVYAAQNVAYSVKLKHVAFVDVGLIAAGFLLRVLAGAVAIGVPASWWLLACTALLALFFGLGKRAHELAWADKSGTATTTRAALAGYSLPVVRALMMVLGVATLAAYTAYTLDPRTVEFFGTPWLVLTSPFVAVGIVRFLMLALWQPTVAPPTDAMMRDPAFLAILVAASAAVLAIIYA
nr:decaprenyl-phosphate phosphoribosyltransferase [Kofleriaceae bacterium]